MADPADNDASWLVPNIQKAHEERLRATRRWIIAETDAGFEVHEWLVDGVAPWSTYPIKESAAARLLQLMGIRHAIVPQAYPETVCIGNVFIVDEPSQPAPEFGLPAAEYGYHWFRLHADGTTFIAYRDEKDGLWYIPGVGVPVSEPGRSATRLGPVAPMIEDGGSIDP